MEVKKDILWRVYLSYIIIIIVCVAIFGKAAYIQQVQGSKWRSMSDSLHQKIEEVEAERGTIYSEDGQMLSTSIPQFDVYIDFAAEGLRAKSGQRFRESIDSLSILLSQLFADKNSTEYKRLLKDGYKKKDRYFELQQNISYRQYEVLKTFPLVRLGRNKSGFIIQEETIRLNPYKLLAYRTIGLDRENAQKIGLEKTYDTILKGNSGKRLVRYIAGGVSVPVEDFNVEPENGKDIVTTLDVFMQEVTENALMKMMVQNEAQHGCAIVMEVKTGKIKAIANLGKREDGTYTEDFNYAISTSEPGSTFKLATIMALFEDKKANINTNVNLDGGTWRINGETVYDSEKHGRTNVTLQQAFELSSNVGMAKLAYTSYANNPKAFIRRLQALKLDTLTGVDITGERRPIIHKPGSKIWSATTLPWMSFGYNLEVTPLQTAMLYNAVANNGTMVKPYLLHAVKQEGEVLRQTTPKVVMDKVCSPNTLQQVKTCLEGVCVNGTGKDLFKNSLYTVAGKTGTALVADGNRGYEDKIYQSSFAGYFPANNPEYTCVVIIKNKPHATLFYGASVAGPVFKEIADRLYAACVKNKAPKMQTIAAKDSAFNYSTISYKYDAATIGKTLQMRIQQPNATANDFLQLTINQANVATQPVATNAATMPTLKGMGLKDAVLICENAGLKTVVRGKGKVSTQSIIAGQYFSKGQVIELTLN
jgi:cell division protein FtsI (penicillin-binding protein 3)